MIEWSDDFKSYLLKYFIFDKYGNLIDFDRQKRRKQPIDKYGYKTIKIKGKYYKVHQILYFLYHGKQATKVIDHINGNKLDNNYYNLRDVLQGENCKNTHKKNKDTGVVGVYYDRYTKGLKSKFTTRINGKTLLQAIQKRKEYNLNEYL